jgi:hypothetical protein
MNFMNWEVKSEGQVTQSSAILLRAMEGECTRTSLSDFLFFHMPVALKPFAI